MEALLMSDLGVCAACFAADLSKPRRLLKIDILKWYLSQGARVFFSLFSLLLFAASSAESNAAPEMLPVLVSFTSLYSSL